MQFSARVLVWGLVCLPVMACSGGVDLSQNPKTPAGESSASVLWSADHESGNLSQWYRPELGPSGSYGGGEFNSAGGRSELSRNHAHSGNWSVKMEIPGASSASGARLFRWAEPHGHVELRYSAWYYFPQAYTVGKWWSI